jgi:hypothetical protein
MKQSAQSVTKHHHCIISGPGRAGTTFLVILLTRLGVQTGFTLQTAANENLARAGLETWRIAAGSPYVIKSPWLCDRIDRLLASDPSVVIDHVLLPVRALEAASESRASVQERTTGSRSGETVPGGLWLTTDPSQQEQVLERQLARLVVSLARCDIPNTLLWYPRLAQDASYLYAKLRFLLGNTSLERFKAVYKETVRPDWVHQYSPADVP